MMGNLCLSLVIAVAFLAIRFAGAVQLTQDTPCLPNQSCLLRCVLESNSGNFTYTRGANRINSITVCTLGFCNSFFPNHHNFTRVSNMLSYLEILRFANYDADIWSCSDGPNGQVVSIQVDQNILPVGPLTFGTTLCRMVNPALLTCSLPNTGSPRTTLTLADSSNQTVNSSQTGSVTGTVTRGGQASCSVTWSAFPSYKLNINPVTCDVQVPAKAVITSVQQGSTVRVTCEAYGGYPAASVFGDWTHAWGGRVLRTFPAQAQNNQATLTLTSFQDTGTYTCSVSNGVEGFISNSTTIAVEDLPQLLLTSDLAVQAAEVNESVVLFSTLYSVPNITSYTWSFGSFPIYGASVGFQPGISPATVSLPVYDSRVAVPGLNASLAFRFKEIYAGSYSLEACNRVGCRSVLIRLQETGPPHAPLITGATATSDSVTLTWVPGFAGGDFFQWFHLKYRRQDGSEERWVDEARQQNRSSSERTPVTLTVAGLDPDTSYVFSLQAQNTRRERNRSSFVEWIVTTGKGGLGIGAAVAVTAVATFVLSVGLTLAIVFIILRYRRNAGLGGDSKHSNSCNAPTSDASKPEELHLPAYGQAGTASAQQENGAYSVLDPVTRDLPHPAPVYQGLAPSGGHGSLQSCDNQAYANAPAEEHYSSVANF